MNNVLNVNKKPLFVCIGTPRSFYDNSSNRIGKKLKEFGFDVIMNLDAKNLKERREEIKKYDKDKYQVIAIDVSYDKNYDYEKKITHKYSKKPIYPGRAVGHTLKPIGDCSIRIFIQYLVNIKNYLDLVTAICSKTGDEKIYKLEEKIANEIKEYYGK